MILNWVETGTLIETPNGWDLAFDADSLSAPPSVTGMIRARIDGLPRPEKDSLQQGSVLGIDFTFQLFERMKAGLGEEDDWNAILSTLAIKEFLRLPESSEHDAIRFKNLATKNAAYETLLQHNRAILHTLAAKAIEELHPNELDPLSRIIFRHYELAEASDQSIRWGIRALKYLKKSFLNKEALELAQHLQKNLGSEDETSNPEKLERILTVLIVEESICDVLGKRERQTDLLERICKLSNLNPLRNRRAEALLRMASFCIHTGKFEESYEHCLQAEQLASEANDKKQLMLAIGNIGLIHIYLNRIEPAQARLEEALGLSKRLGDRRAESNYLDSLGGLYFSRNEFTEALNCVKDAIAILQEINDRHALGNEFANLSGINFRQNHLLEAIQNTRQAMDIYREIGCRKDEGIALSNLAFFHTRNGETSEAIERYREAIAIHREVQDYSTEVRSLSNFISLLEEMNDIPSAMPMYPPLLELLAKRKQIDKRMEMLFKYISNLLATDQVDEAESALAKFHENLTEKPSLTHSIRYYYSVGMVALKRTPGNREAAQEAIRKITELVADESELTADLQVLVTELRNRIAD